MNSCFDITAQNFTNRLQKLDFKNYLEYINKLAPAFSKVIYSLTHEEANVFEEQNHKDVDKYLYKPLFAYQKNFGKLHRPLTCILTYLACSQSDFYNINDVYAVAAAIENFQTAALIHDDIADKAELRRGKPCLHKQVGSSLAINIGDYGLSMTVGAVLHHLEKSKFLPEKIIEILDQFIFMEYMTIQGQAMDLGWAEDDRFDVSTSDYFTMATKKSAYYSASVPCVLGAICANSSEEEKTCLQLFGEKIGLAFQIRDDLLNITASNTAKQKDVFSDITEGKLTLCAVAALEFADKKDSQTLKDILMAHTKDKVKLKKAVSIMKKSGALDYAEDQAQNLCDEALTILSSGLPDNIWRDLLFDMASWARCRSL